MGRRVPLGGRVSRGELEVLVVALVCAGTVAVVGLVGVRLVGRRSVRAALISVALVSVLSVVTGVVGTARAMFISAHDLGVVLPVSAVAGAVGLAGGTQPLGGRGEGRRTRTGRRPCSRRGHEQHSRRGRHRRARGDRWGDRRRGRAVGGGEPTRAGAGVLAARARGVGEPRPANAACRAAGDGRSPGGRRRGGHPALLQPDPPGGRPPRGHGRRPLRALPDPVRHARVDHRHRRHPRADRRRGGGLAPDGRGGRCAPGQPLLDGRHERVGPRAGRRPRTRPGPGQPRRQRDTAHPVGRRGRGQRPCRGRYVRARGLRRVRGPRG